MSSKMPLTDRDSLSLAYTPGVAEVCLAIAAEPELARRYTWTSRLVAVVSDGTAVLGLGNIGPAASLPVMEGKCALFREFGGLNAVPIVLDTTDAGRDRGDRASGSRRRSAASTSKTSRRRAASRSRIGCGPASTSRSFTMTSTAPRSWCWRRCATRPR